MSTSLPPSIMNLFVDEADKAEFVLVNNFFWGRSELECLQLNAGCASDLLFVYQQHLSHLQRCIELLESVFT